jgi:transketolase
MAMLTSEPVETMVTAALLSTIESALKGGYVAVNTPNAAVTIVSTGSEVSIVLGLSIEDLEARNGHNTGSDTVLLLEVGGSLNGDAPTVMALTRQNLPQLELSTIESALKGGYVAVNTPKLGVLTAT